MVAQRQKFEAENWWQGGRKTKSRVQMEELATTMKKFRRCLRGA